MQAGRLARQPQKRQRMQQPRSSPPLTRRRAPPACLVLLREQSERGNSAFHALFTYHTKAVFRSAPFPDELGMSEMVCQHEKWGATNASQTARQRAAVRKSCALQTMQPPCRCSKTELTAVTCFHDAPAVTEKEGQRFHEPIHTREMEWSPVLKA